MPYWCQNSSAMTNLSPARAGWTFGWYKSSIGGLLPFGISFPDGYNPENTYPVLMGMGGSFAGASDTIGIRAASIVAGWSISQPGGYAVGAYRLDHASSLSFAVGGFTSFTHEKGYYYFRVTDVGDGYLDIVCENPDILTDATLGVDVGDFSECRYGNIQYMTAQPASFQRRSDLQAKYGPFIGIAFGIGTLNASWQESEADSIGAYARLAYLIKAFITALKAGDVTYYTRVGDADDIDVTAGFWTTGLTTDFDGIDGNTNIVQASIDSDRIYAFGISFGAFHWSQYSRYYNFLSGALCIDAASHITEDVRAVYDESYTSAVHRTSPMEMPENTFSAVGSYLTGGDWNTSKNDFDAIATDSENHQKRFLRYKFWLDEFMKNGSGATLVSVQGLGDSAAVARGQAASLKSIVSAAAKYPHNNFYVFCPIKLPDNSYAFDRHVTGNQMLRARGGVVDGNYYVADSATKDRIIEFHPVAELEGNEVFPLDIVFNSRLANRAMPELVTTALQVIQENTVTRINTNSLLSFPSAGITVEFFEDEAFLYDMSAGKITLPLIKELDNNAIYGIVYGSKRLILRKEGRRIKIVYPIKYSLLLRGA